MLSCLGPSGSRRLTAAALVVLDEPGVVDELDASRYRRAICHKQVPGVGRLGDLSVVRRDHLGPVGGVDLVAVVGRRVVTSRDHDAGGGSQVLDGIGGDRRRQRASEDEYPDACGGGHLRHVARELGRAVAGVAPDDEPAAGMLGAFVEQPSGDARRRPANHEPVHPRRTGAERPAEPRRPEAERDLETGAESGDVTRVDEPRQLGARRGVGIGGHPGLDLGPKVGRDRPGPVFSGAHSAESTPSMRPTR